MFLPSERQRQRELQTKNLLYKSMMMPFKKTANRAVLWSVGVGAAIPLLPGRVVAAEKLLPSSDQKPCCCANKKIRPSQLPIYDEPEDLFEVQYHISDKGHMQEGVSVVRKELCSTVEATKEFRNEVERIYHTGKAHTAGQIDYLMDEENVIARGGAMAVGGVLGLMLGARRKGGIFKKLLFTTAGVGATSAALYPKYTKVYTDELVNNANTYATVAFNFISGVKPQQLSESNNDTATAAAPTANKDAEQNKKVVESEKSKKASSKPKPITGDSGQSNPNDADMYTTRS